jgi:hypothetical protein
MNALVAGQVPGKIILAGAARSITPRRDNRVPLTRVADGR